MRLRPLGIGLLVVAAFVAVAGKRLLNPEASTPAVSIQAPASQSYLVLFGIGDKTAASWNGSITATGASILNLQGWRFGGTDAITGATSWRLATRLEAGPPGVTGNVLLMENGVIVTVAAANGPVTFSVQTTLGNFTFSSQDVSFGASKAFLNGRALVAQTGVPLQLTSSNEEEDFPSMAQSNDDVYLV
ncbi:MAG TPA: hypothetical protein VGV35_02990, partial [Bryobacteraceae bacterium]|nr:hypothetical protein [Bryobacteraceae bacterium]